MGKATQYEYLYGPYFLVAPIYQSTKADDEGNDVRNGIYLPEGTWIDYFSGDVYEGGRIINNFDAPLWKLPVFVKSGAIIPLANPNNNVHEIDRSLRIYELYPDDYSAFHEYDDDGTTEAYRTEEAFARTYIESQTDDKGRVTITIYPTEGSFDGMVREKATELRVNVTTRPKKVTARIGGKKVKLVEVTSPEAFQQGENVCFYEEAPNLNRFATPGTPFAEKDVTAYTMLHTWMPVENADYYEIRSLAVCHPRHHGYHQHPQPGRFVAPPLRFRGGRIVAHVL